MQTFTHSVAHMETRVGSRYWITPELVRRLENSDPDSVEYLMALASVQRQVKGFVRLVTRRELPVVFSTGKQNYALPNGLIVISAVKRLAQLDGLSGRAMHEGSHIIRSNRTVEPGSLPLFAFLENLQEADKRAMFGDYLLERAAHLQDDPFERLRLILNILEDRRIDSWMYETAPGYRVYYDAFYRELLLTDEALAYMGLPISRVPILRNYRFHLVCMILPNAFRRALPGLDKIWNIVDLPHIRRYDVTGDDSRWDSWRYYARSGMDPLSLAALPEMVQDAMRILEIVYRNAVLPKELSIPIPAPEDDDPALASGLPDPSNWDMPEQSKATETMVQNMERGTDSTDNTGKDSLSPNQNAAVENFQDNQTQNISVSGGGFKTDVYVFRRLTRAVCALPSFPFTSSPNGVPADVADTQRAINAGWAMGSRLATRLDVMGDETREISAHLEQGRLDRSQLAGLGVHRKDVFYTEEISHLKPVTMHLTVDASSSMLGEKWRQAMTLAAAMARVSELVPQVRVIISLRAGGTMQGNSAFVAIVFDSLVNTFSHVRTLWGYLRPYGGTPEGLTFAAIRNIHETEGLGTRKFFVNISDGMPDAWVTSATGEAVFYRGNEARTHTAHEVNMIRQAGWAILSYFVGAESPHLREHFREMYGRNATFVNPECVPAIARALNHLFLG